MLVGGWGKSLGQGNVELSRLKLIYKLTERSEYRRKYVVGGMELLSMLRFCGSSAFPRKSRKSEVFPF